MPTTSRRSDPSEFRNRQQDTAMDSISLWKQEIDAIPLLTADRESLLVVRIADGDPEAKRELIEAHLRLVIGIARRYANNEEELKDFIQEGNIGLIRAAEKYAAKYQPGLSYRFSTSATWWVRYHITRGMMNNKRPIRLPVYLEEAIDQLKKIQRRLVAQLKREPSSLEISNAFNALESTRTVMTPEKVVDILVWSEDVLSLNALAANAEENYGDSGDLLENTDTSDPGPGSEEHLTALHSQILVRTLLLKSRLKPQERRVIELRYGLEDGQPHTLEQCGKAIGGVSREYVRQLEVSALRKLRKASEIEPEAKPARLAG